MKRSNLLAYHFMLFIYVEQASRGVGRGLQRLVPPLVAEDNYPVQAVGDAGRVGQRDLPPQDESKALPQKERHLSLADSAQEAGPLVHAEGQRPPALVDLAERLERVGVVHHDEPVHDAHDGIPRLRSGEALFSKGEPHCCRRVQ